MVRSMWILLLLCCIGGCAGRVTTAPPSRYVEHMQVRGEASGYVRPPDELERAAVPDDTHAPVHPSEHNMAGPPVHRHDAGAP